MADSKFQYSSSDGSDTDDDVYQFRFVLNRRAARRARRASREPRVDVIDLVHPPPPTPVPSTQATSKAQPSPSPSYAAVATPKDQPQKTFNLPILSELDLSGLTPRCSPEPANQIYTIPFTKPSTSNPPREATTPESLPELAAQPLSSDDEILELIPTSEEIELFKPTPKPPLLNVSILDQAKDNPSRGKEGRGPKKMIPRITAPQNVRGAPQGSTQYPRHFIVKSMTHERDASVRPKTRTRIPVKAPPTSTNMHPIACTSKTNSVFAVPPPPHSAPFATPHPPPSLGHGQLAPPPGWTFYPKILVQIELAEKLIDVLDEEYEAVRATVPATIRDEIFPTIKVDAYNRLRIVHPSKQSNKEAIHHARGINIMESGIQAYIRLWATRNPGRAIPCASWNSEGCPLQGLHGTDAKPGFLLVHMCSLCWIGSKTTPSTMSYYHNSHFCNLKH